MSESRLSSASPTDKSAATKPPLGTYPPKWLGTRLLPLRPNGYGEIRPTPKALRNRRFTLPDVVPMLPGKGFVARVHNPARKRDLAKSSWRPGCPARKDQLAAIRMTFWGFDDERHTGELMVHSDVAHDVVRVFKTLYRARFPMERMLIVGPWKPGGPTTGDGNGTGAFVCRPSTGASYFSQHAYGLAIDINTFQNPYAKGDLVLPELASAYLDRGWRRRGMVQPEEVVVKAFRGIGWEWGGSWRTAKDYQHFSRNGR